MPSSKPVFRPDDPDFNEPLVSVILPVYNGENLVGQAIESATSQTYRNLEIIVIDDGSTDHTLGVVKEYAAADSRIQIIHQQNGGVARARNRGLADAKGEFVAPLDADDIWVPGKIERQVERMREGGETTGLVYCWWVWIDDKGRVLDRSPNWQIEGDVLQRLLQVNFTGNASVPLYRRRCLDAAGGYDESLEQRHARGCEDWDLALRVAAQCQVAVVPELLMGYRRLSNSMSAQVDVMWRSQSLVAESLQKRNPGISQELLQWSRDQFALYIAGVSFRAGAYGDAILWALRAWRSGLLFDVLPYVIRVLLRGLRPRPAATVTPGVTLDAASIPQPLIPYDRIYARRFGKPDFQTAPAEIGRTPPGRQST